MHEPPGYACPICRIVAQNDEPLLWRDDQSIAFLALHQQPNNHGALLVCPCDHVENIYDLPAASGAHLFGVTKKLALALKRALRCDGISVLQHNEPAGGQDVWHYHQHVVPRFHDDQYGSQPGQVMSLEQRAEFAERIRRALPSGKL